MSFTAESKSKNTLLRRQALVHEIVSQLQEDSYDSDEFDESQYVVLIRGDGG